MNKTFIDIFTKYTNEELCSGFLDYVNDTFDNFEDSEIICPFQLAILSDCLFLAGFSPEKHEQASEYEHYLTYINDSGNAYYLRVTHEEIKFLKQF